MNLIEPNSIVSLLTLISVILGVLFNSLKTQELFKSQVEKNVRLHVAVENLQKDVQKVQQTLNNGLSKTVSELSNEQKIIKNEINTTKRLLEMKIKCNSSPSPSSRDDDDNDNDNYKND
jgi:uncharacterized membrane-anchored protein YhcB (DUF1043 family)